MLVKTLIGLFSFFFMVNVSLAKSLPEELQDFFVALHQPGDKVTVTVLTPEEKWPVCQIQKIQRHAGSRNWGRLSIPIQCDKQRRFIQVDVSVKGKYLIAKKTLIVMTLLKLLPLAWQRAN